MSVAAPSRGPALAAAACLLAAAVAAGLPFRRRPPLPQEKNTHDEAQGPRLPAEPLFAPLLEAPEDAGRVIIGAEQGAPLGIVGFEGSFYTQTSDGTFHFLSAGRLLPPRGSNYTERNVHMRFDHWQSSGGSKWDHRGKLHDSSGNFDDSKWEHGTALYQSSGNFNGTDRRASAWAPMAAFDREEDRWHLFYIAYRASPDYKVDKRHFYDQWDGEVYHAVSAVKGELGIGGPYTDVGPVMDQESQGGFDPALDSWEGDHGVDMFFPFRADNGTWLAFYGSEFGRYPNFCNPVCRQVALAHLVGGSSLGAGRWNRTHGGPLDASFRPSKPGIENAVVAKTADGAFFVAVYHIYVPGAIGVSFSRDGVTWARQAGDVFLHRAGKGGGFCDDDVTTVCGLVPEPSIGKGVYSVMYTAGGGGSGSKSGGGVVCRAYLVNRAEADAVFN